MNKKILKAYEVISKYNQNHKFNSKKNRSFIHLYLLFIQNKYRFNFDFKKLTSEPKFSNCLNSLYQGISKNKLMDLLFPEDKLLGEIFLLPDKFSIDKFLTKLEETTYSLNYVNTNIQLVDFLGNTENDVAVVKVGFCLLLFQEQFPHLKVNSKLQKNIIHNLIKTSRIKDNTVNYVNSQSILLLFLLKKGNKIPELDNYFKLLGEQQNPQGIWPSGFNDFIVENTSEIDMLHTSIGLINCLEYQIHQKIHEKNSHKTKLVSENIKNISDEKLENDNENVENFANILETQNVERLLRKKNKINQTLERFRDVNSQPNQKYYLDLNFYNVTLILILVVVFINLPRLKLLLLKL